jgi:hypothetical protein
MAINDGLWDDNFETGYGTYPGEYFIMAVNVALKITG